MPLDLLLVNPGNRSLIYQGLGNSLTAVEPPLWCRLIAGYVRDRALSVEIFDGDAGGDMPDVKPRLIAIVAFGHQPSASTQQMAGMGDLIYTLRAFYPGAKIILLGGHVSALPFRTLQEEPADYACTGEGQETILGLLQGDPEEDIPGLAWRDGGEIVINAPAKKIADLGELHGQTWDMLPMQAYRAHNWQCFDGSPRSPYAAIYTSLGCPYACSFCCINAPFGGKGYRTRGPEAVVAEVEYLYREHGVRTFKITDEMFVLKPSHYLPICEGLAALPFAHELNIWAYARIDTVKPDTLATLRRAGIRWLALGIESGSAHVRDGAKKSLDENDILLTVRAIQKAGINVLGNFIFGLPDDTMETMNATLDLALGLDLDFANFYSAMAYPGSALFSQAKPGDLPERWSGYSQHSFDTKPLPTEALTSAEVLAFRDHAFRQYFTDTRYRAHVMGKFGAAALLEVDAMLAHDLPRALVA